MFVILNVSSMCWACGMSRRFRIENREKRNIRNLFSRCWMFNYLYYYRIGQMNHFPPIFPMYDTNQRWYSFCIQMNKLPWMLHLQLVHHEFCVFIDFLDGKQRSKHAFAFNSIDKWNNQFNWSSYCRKLQLVMLLNWNRYFFLLCL